MGRSLRNCRVSVSLTPREKALLVSLAEKSGLSVSRVAQEAITDFLDAQSGEKVDVIGRNIDEAKSNE